MDGDNYWSMFWRIALPLAKPALIVTFIFEFQAKWFDLMTPLIYLRDTTPFTVPLGLKILLDRFNAGGGGARRLPGDHRRDGAARPADDPRFFAGFQQYFIQRHRDPGTQGVGVASVGATAAVGGDAEPARAGPCSASTSAARRSPPASSTGTAACTPSSSRRPTPSGARTTALARLFELGRQAVARVGRRLGRDRRGRDRLRRPARLRARRADRAAPPARLARRRRSTALAEQAFEPAGGARERRDRRGRRASTATARARRRATWST